MGCGVGIGISVMRWSWRKMYTFDIDDMDKLYKLYNISINKLISDSFSIGLIDE